MSFIKKYKNKLIFFLLVLAVLIFTFCLGGNTSKNNINTASPKPAYTAYPTAIPTETPEISPSAVLENIPDTPLPTESIESAELNNTETAGNNMPNPVPENSEPPEIEINSNNKDNTNYETAENQESSQNTYDEPAENKTEISDNEIYSENQDSDKPVPIDPQNAVISDKELTCTLSVRCDTILKNINHFDKEKLELIPTDGVIFAQKEVVFYEGETVFNLLLREMKKNNIHMEYTNTPVYNSAYIEGINNIYEFDCGELSGWIYKVNGWFPNYGCSRYELHGGDSIEWVYTCDLGADVGGGYSAGNGKNQ